MTKLFRETGQKLTILLKLPLSGSLALISDKVQGEDLKKNKSSFLIRVQNLYFPPKFKVKTIKTKENVFCPNSLKLPELFQKCSKNARNFVTQGGSLNFNC